MTPEMLAPIAAMMDDVHVAILQSAYERFWVFSQHGLLLTMEDADG